MIDGDILVDECKVFNTKLDALHNVLYLRTNFECYNALFYPALSSRCGGLLINTK
jgi:hypothetical protein